MEISPSDNIQNHKLAVGLGGSKYSTFKWRQGGASGYEQTGWIDRLASARHGQNKNSSSLMTKKMWNVLAQSVMCWCQTCWKHATDRNWATNWRHLVTKNRNTLKTVKCFHTLRLDGVGLQTITEINIKVPGKITDGLFDDGKEEEEEK